MIRRLLARLRYADGGPVVEHSAPPEPGAHSAAHAAREGEIADIDAQMWEAWRRGEKVLVDRLLDMRLGVRPPKPRRSVPVIPGRTP
jgi:hypothetical protein